jgi:hypothetical protein
MSGIETIVGLILGGVPIVLEAYDRYCSISKTFTTFRQHSKELLRLDAFLDAQKSLFRSNVARLLRVLTNDRDKASSLLSDDANWAGFRIHGISHTRVDVVQNPFKSWKAILDQIYNILQSICSEVETFRLSCLPESARVGYPVLFH